MTTTATAYNEAKNKIQNGIARKATATTNDRDYIMVISQQGSILFCGGRWLSLSFGVCPGRPRAVVTVGTAAADVDNDVATAALAVAWR